MAKSKECKTCELNREGCVINNQEGFEKGGCGAWVERKGNIGGYKNNK